MNDQTENLDAEFEAMQQEAESEVAYEEAPVEEKEEVAAETTPVEVPQEPPQETPQHVPLATFLETRNELKSTRQQMDELQAQLDALQNPPEPIPDINEDPVGFLQKQGELTQEKIKELAAQMGQAQENQRANDARQYIDNIEKAFAAENPDYHEAIKHLQQTRAAQHAIIGIPPEHAQKAVNDELAWLTQNAIQSGKNPAAVAYALSQSMGWKGKEAQMTGRQSLKQLAKAQENASNLASMPGQTGTDELTIEAANQMSDAEFDKLSDADFERLAS